MDETDREFKYKTDASGFKLLGILMIVLGPIAFAFSFQGDDGGILIFGIPISGPAVPWIVRFGALLLLYFGVGMVRDGIKAQRKGLGIRLTSTGMSVLGAPEIPYGDISKLSVSQYEGFPFLSLTHPGGEVGLARSRMKSKDFDELKATLTEKCAVEGFSSASNKSPDA